MSAKLSCRSKVDRAKQHIADLKRLFTAFEKSDAYLVSHKDNPQTHERTYYVQSMAPIPEDFSMITGDVLQNLRSALDHLIHAAFFKQDAIWPTDTRISFPIGKDSADYLSSNSRRHVRGLKQPAVDVLDMLKPYQGGDRSLWRLHTLNNTDKHRLLIPAFSSLTSHTTTPAIRKAMLEALGNPFNSSILPDLYRIQARPLDREFPLKQGSELLTIPLSELDDNMKFTFDIAFNEPVIREEIIIDALRIMEWTVTNAIDRFDERGLI